MVKSLKKLNRLLKKKREESETLADKIDSHDLSSEVQFGKAMNALEKMMSKQINLTGEGGDNDDENPSENAPLGGGKSGFSLNFNMDSDSEDENAFGAKQKEQSDFLDISEVNKASSTGLKKHKNKTISRSVRRKKIAKKRRETGYADRLEERSMKAMAKEIKELVRKNNKRRARRLAAK